MKQTIKQHLQPVVRPLVRRLLLLIFIVTAPTSMAAAEEPVGIQMEGMSEDGTRLVFSHEKTEVQGELVGGWASIVLTQTFHNPFDVPIEALYSFPLPHNAAVDTMALIVGNRFIQGEVQEIQEARETFERAKKEGRRAALLEQNRPNVFYQRIANVMPGDDIVVSIHYAAPLRYEDAEYLFELPTVVGPRYIPAPNPGGPAAAPLPIKILNIS